jgi:hypothetical protein
MSIVCTGEKGRFVLQGIDGYSSEVVLERANPGWSAEAKPESGVVARDSALTRGRAVERLLRHKILDERQLAGIMTEVDQALADCPE